MRFFLTALAVICGLQSASAFSPMQQKLNSKNPGFTNLVQKQEQIQATIGSSVLTPNMVAGGAERAMQDEYYDGMCLLWS